MNQSHEPQRSLNHRQLKNKSDVTLPIWAYKIRYRDDCNISSTSRSNSKIIATLVIFIRDDPFDMAYAFVSSHLGGFLSAQRGWERGVGHHARHLNANSGLFTGDKCMHMSSEELKMILLAENRATNESLISTSLNTFNHC